MGNTTTNPEAISNNADSINYIYMTLTAFLSSAGTYFLQRRKNKASAMASEVENVAKALEIWRETSEQLRKEYEAIKIELKVIKDQNDILTQSLDTVMKENAELKSKLA